jgi:hypothetical protein
LNEIIYPIENEDFTTTTSTTTTATTRPGANVKKLFLFVIYDFS